MKEWTEIIDGKKVKVVNSQWYQTEADLLHRKVSKAYNDEIEVHDEGAYSRLSHKENPVKMGVNWAAVGTVSTERAMEFAQNLMEAAKLADGFKYNGYFVKYISWQDLDEEERNEIRSYEAENWN